MTMDEFSWSFVCRSLRTDVIHIGDVQVRDEHEKDEVIRYIFLISCSMPIPWPSHLPSFSSLDDLFGRHKTTDFSYAIKCYPLVFLFCLVFHTAKQLRMFALEKTIVICVIQ